MRFSKAVVKYRIPIIVVTLLLMIPSALGMANTRINYDMLDYLPADMDTVIGQNELLDDFGKGAFSMMVVENMPDKDIASLCEKIEDVEHVETVLWYSTLADMSIPMELLPDKLYSEFNSDGSTLVAIFFDSSTSADVTMDAVIRIREIAGKQCFVSGMSALVTDLKDLCEAEEPICGLSCAVCLLCHDAVFGRLADTICIFDINRYDDSFKSWHKLLFGRGFVYNQGTFCCFAACSYYGLLNLFVAQLQRVQREVQR